MKGQSGTVKRLWTMCIAAACLLHHGVAAAADASASGPVSDVRILIDISGSMKHNDPHNLRAPALRLIVGLLPAGAESGVWTFGQYVNMLVPLDKVDDKWKAQAQEASKKINSNGLYTNIEEALRRATWDWNTPDPHVRRSIIMLTDGIVDVDKDDAKDRASRRRIVDELLPRLQKAGATIYTVALSNSADEALLKQLAAGTKGWHEQVNDADALEKSFLHMFEKTTQRDTLPLVDNKIKVDDHIRELTLLVFRKDAANPTQLTEPVGKTIGQGNAPDNVQWHHETRYDLITIEKPMPGQWRVLADTDPDNRVMVVTNLKMQTTTLANHVLVGQKIPLTMSVTQNGATITKAAFLKFIDAKVSQMDADGSRREWPLKDDGHDPDKTANDGVYTALLSDSLTPGQHEIRVFVDGITFQRESQQLIQVDKTPVIATVTANDPGKPDDYTLSVIPRDDLIDTKAMTVHATVTDPGGNSKEIEISKTHQNEWSHDLRADDMPGVHTVTLKIASRDKDGQPVTYQAGPLSFGKAVASTPKTAAADKVIPAPVAVKPAQAAAPAPVRTPPAAHAHHWIVIVAMVVLTLCGLGAGYFIYRRTRRKANNDVSQLEEQLQTDETVETAEAAEAAEAEIMTEGEA